MFQTPDWLPLNLSRLFFAPVIVAALVVNSAEAQLVVAHRGASADAPENTLAAFDLAWEKGADAIEGDFYLSSDGHIVTIHDGTTKRTAGIELNVAKSTLNQLKQLDVGTWKSPRYRDQKIPTLPEVLAGIPAGKKIFIEIKCGPEIVSNLKKALDDSGLIPEQTVVIAFDKNVIARTKQLIPNIKAYWLTGFKKDEATGQWSPSLREVLKTLKEIHADGLDSQANPEVVDAEFVKALRDSDMEFHVWTIDKLSAASHFRRLGVDSITTNHPKFIRQAL